MLRTALIGLTASVLAFSATAQDLDYETLEAPAGNEPLYQLDQQDAPAEAQSDPMLDEFESELMGNDRAVEEPAGEPASEPVTQEPPADDLLEGDTIDEPAEDEPVIEGDEDSSALDPLAEPIPAIDKEVPPAVEEELEPRQPVTAPDRTKAVLRGLDKITGRILEFEVPLNEPTKFGTLSVVLKYCEKAPPEETPEVAAFLKIFDDTHPNHDAAVQAAAAMDDPAASTVIAADDVQADGADAANGVVFSGWMFASSPSVSAMEHPIYDVWVIDCKR